MDENLVETSKVVFYSEDGRAFRLFVDGKEIKGTKGITITAGNDEFVTVTPNLVCFKDYKNIKD
ncbi:hypothetical protein [Ornithinibacillus sp. JPR2-1]|uniref:hypothetical protein n=1 Tax=Ornithinibacillus sp. JPR2-1 TaxID=2094019 RepID=UPI0031DF3BB2